MRARPWTATLGALAAVAVTGCGSSSSHHKSTSSGSATTANAAAVAARKITSGGFTTQAFATGVTITFGSGTAKTSVTQPDDITKLGSDIFVGFQNNVGPQGEPVPAGSPGAGNRQSTIVEFSSTGSTVAKWQILGHIDGLTADPGTGKVIATTNEDANPHLYTVDPANRQLVTYQVPSLPSHGGLDAITIYHGMVLVSGSAPGTIGGKAPPQASYPAVYVVTLNTSQRTASLRPMFGDEASATRADPGMSGTTRLALTDPDSNFVVPSAAPRFGGQFMLTSQGDYEDIFASGTSGKRLSVLKLSQSVDDTQCATSPSSTLYV
ncbi:MAG: hypothetical protein ACRDK8_13110, partial [Solirubrobacteraceae bacterium]